MSIFSKIKYFAVRNGEPQEVAYRRAQEFIDKKSGSYACQLIFTHNGYAVEYRKLRRVY